ncbi:aldehyde dehydrogenase family protein [Candidatus Methanomassiliicoccus intestinalis]|uniref:aldehyde dehydrogenase family protein n=1 Tax=Candidatus Methanomassiliicoccus intestinalis TaxID=1406512 RepID=UPI0037DCDEDD
MQSSTEAGEEYIIKTNPATLEEFGRIKCDHPEDVPAALQAARLAQSKWMKLSYDEKAVIMSNIQEAIISNIEDLARTICGETGKPKSEAIATDIFAALSAGEYANDMMLEVFKKSKIDLGDMAFPMKLAGRSSYIAPRPIGVVAIISPWNYPLGIPYSQTIMALAAGNAVIIKPSSETPLTAVKMLEVMKKAGLPDNLVQVLIGSGRTVGDALLTSDVDRIVFTGSGSVGRRVMAQASQRLTPVTLELGGKDPMIVLKDADLERATSAAVWGSFVNSGQTCVCVKRIYVDETIYEQFLELFKNKTLMLKQGWGWDDQEISLGSLINEAALNEMEMHVEKAVNEGAKVLIGGKKNPNLKGYYFEPTILVDTPQNSAAVQEEIFGPIVTVMKFSSEEEAIALANDNKYALAGSVWTANLIKGKVLAELVSSGTVVVNNLLYTYGLAATPWGGNGESGFGRTHGKFGFEELTEPHHIHVDKGKYPEDPWWFPYSPEKSESLSGFMHSFYAQDGSSIKALLQLHKMMRK